MARGDLHHKPMRGKSPLSVCDQMMGVTEALKSVRGMQRSHLKNEITRANELQGGGYPQPQQSSDQEITACAKRRESFSNEMSEYEWTFAKMKQKKKVSK